MPWRSSTPSSAAWREDPQRPSRRVELVAPTPSGRGRSATASCPCRSARTRHVPTRPAPGSARPRRRAPSAAPSAPPAGCPDGRRSRPNRRTPKNASRTISSVHRSPEHLQRTGHRARLGRVVAWQWHPNASVARCSSIIELSVAAAASARGSSINEPTTAERRAHERRHSTPTTMARAGRPTQATRASG